MTHDLDAMAARVTDKTRIVFVANPNNPTGTMVTGAELDAFISSMPERVIVCVDEAYVEYVRSAGFPDTLSHIRAGRPVLLLRTFSKIYGLAGLRVGYGVSHPDIIGYMSRVRQPFNVNSLAQVAALAALDDDAHVSASRENNEKGLNFLFEGLRKLKLKYVDTEANFFLIKVGDGRGVYEALLREGVIVRPMASYGLPEYIRVTVGLPGENERFLDALARSID